MILLFLAILGLSLLAILSEKLYFTDFEYQFRTKVFNRVLSGKQAVLDHCLEDMKPVLANSDHHGSINENNIFHIAEQNSIIILEYIDNKLIYWSDNGFDVPYYLIDTLYNKPLVFLQNGWFLTKTIQAGNEMLVGLIRIRTDHDFTNDIIRDGFEKEFRLSENVGFSTDINASEFHINDKNGNFLFTLLFPSRKEISYLIYIPLIFWIFSFIFIILLLMQIVRWLSVKTNTYFSLLFLLISFAIIYYFLLKTRQPGIFFITELFSPYRFFLNDLVPSLGHLFLLSFLSAVFAYVFYRDFSLAEPLKGEKAVRYISSVLYLLAAVAAVSIFNYMFGYLISTSNINFEPYKILELSWFSLAGFVAALTFLMVPVFIIMRMFRNGDSLRWPEVTSALMISLLPLCILNFDDIHVLIPISVFWILLVVTVWITSRIRTGLFNTSVIFSLLFGLYSLYFITILSEEKNDENLKIQAVSFSTENDPEAEHFLLDIWPEISTDSILKSMMKAKTFNKNREDVEKISDYVEETYFKGYWTNYNFGIVLCSNEEMLRIGTAGTIMENCFGFFDSRIKMNGHKLTGTEFYFIENQGGRAYYLGRLLYEAGSRSAHGLFIELYSDVNIFQPGYSELLLDKKYHKYAGLKDYSFAKYINGEIVLQTGDFPYDKTDAEYVGKMADYRIFNSDKFRHILYKNGSATVVISRPEITKGDLLISFAYLFAFILLFSNLIALLIRMPSLKSLTSLNFRQKLQFSYIGILLFAFIMIGIVVSFLTVSQYQKKHRENIKEKLNSVYLELENRLAAEDRISADWQNASYSNLNEFLIRLSNVFNTDINLYDLNGYIIASSRQEIFFRDLISRRINNLAMTNMRDFTRSEYFQNEKIGTLKYISAYVPFYSNDGRVLAYLNLPYFRLQSVLANEISNLLVAVINFTLLLIVITMSLTVFISGRLTAPLSMLSEGLASVELGKKSEHLTYRGSDEIGELVRQYNSMLEELEKSAGKLANSEREYAWREMAKQIAHEIKNPLTPMKLNVQQLLKSWRDKVQDFDIRIENFSKNQIEYIDNLSTIASAFSSFAKMPGNNPVELDLTEQIRTSLELFRNSDNVQFEVEWPFETRIIVYIDKEHLNGIFSNLIKNAIQSLPPGTEGRIGVKTEIRGNRIVVIISDNGTGIPEELRKKMFTPNFTTKSSGMGLGLSIVKRYVENAGGRIWFESEIGKGTMFFVELPIKYTVEKPL